MLGSRTGKLHVRPDLKKQFELHLSEGTVFCFKEDGLSVRDPGELRRGLTALLGLRYGGFEFSQVLPTELERHISVARQTVLELSAALEVDPGSADETEGSLDPKTRFKFREGADPGFEMPDNLRVFLRRAHAQLEAGSSAEELAAALGLHPSVVGLYLMRLRSLEQIAPVRAYAANYKGYSSGYSSGHSNGYSAAPAAAVASVASAFMTMTTTTITTTTTTAASVAAALLTSEPVAARPAPQKSLIRRLLSAFSFGGR